MAEQEENKNENTAAEEAKQERQQPNENKKNIYVEFTGKYYIVKSEGEGSAMYESENKEASLDFANKVAEEHNVKVILDERIHEQEGKDEKPSEGEARKERSDRRRHEERRQNEEGPCNVIIEDDGEYYIVRNDGDRAKLYESKDKEASIDFARKVAKDHEVDLIMLDRDKYVVLEEKYNKNGCEEKDEQNEAKDKGADKQP